MAVPFSHEYSDETLENAPTEATEFLNALGAVPEIRTVMFHCGMKDADIVEGRDLLLAALAQPEAVAPVADTPEAEAQRAAVVEVDLYDEPNYPKFSASLARKFPSAAHYLFHDLAPSRGIQSVKGLALLLARVDHLDNGTDPARAARKNEDKKAAALLGQRGLDAAERQRLRGLVELALGPTSPPPPDPKIRRKALLDLKLWVNEWSTVARANIGKRSYLIRLGLATRRSPTKAAETKKAETTETPTPVDRGDT